jgi:hypothetical protein
MAKKPKPAHHQRPANELSIQVLERIAWFLGYELICTDFSTSLFDERNGWVVAQGDIALSHLRTLYVERELEHVLEK